MLAALGKDHCQTEEFEFMVAKKHGIEYTFCFDVDMVSEALP